MRIENIKKYIGLFLLIAFGLPFICVILVKNFRVFQSGLISFILYGLEATTPTLAALLTTVILSDRNELKLFLKKSYFDNIKIKYIVFTLLMPFIIFALTKTTLYIFVQVTPFISSINAKKLFIIMWVLIAEELGWRGFLQERLDKYFGQIVTPILIGIIWSLWHYHFFLLGTMSEPLVLFFIGCIADSFIFYWITKKSKGNIIPASIWHCIENLCFSLFLITPQYNQGSSEPYFIYTCYSILTAIIISLWGIFSTQKYDIMNC